jgi:hypothetical protein
MNYLNGIHECPLFSSSTEEGETKMSVPFFSSLFSSQVMGPLDIATYNQRWSWITNVQLSDYEAWANANNSIDIDKLIAGGYI